MTVWGAVGCATGLLVLVAAVGVIVMRSGKVPKARLTVCAPEHIAVVTAVWVPVEISATQVLPFLFAHLKPLRVNLLKDGASTWDVII